VSSLAVRSPDLLGRAEQSSPNAAWRRAEGAGLTAKARTERSSMSPQCASSSDTVREIKYQILHFMTVQPDTTKAREAVARRGKRFPGASQGDAGKLCLSERPVKRGSFALRGRPECYARCCWPRRSTRTGGGDEQQLVHHGDDGNDQS
jgi:hypothetical protein